MPTCSGMIAFVFAFSSLVSLTHSQSQPWVPISSTTEPVPDGTGCEITGLHGSNPIMNCLGEHTLEQGALLGALPKLGKQWKMSLEFKPLEETDSRKKLNIIKISGDSTSTRIDPNHAGIFSIWTNPDHHLHFSYAESDDKSWSKNYNRTHVGNWSAISVSQQQVKNREKTCFKYRQVVRINNEEEFSHINKAPQEFQNVEVYASSASRKSQPGVVRNFVLSTGCILSTEMSL